MNQPPGVEARAKTTYESGSRTPARDSAIFIGLELIHVAEIRHLGLISRDFCEPIEIQVNDFWKIQ